MPDYHDNELFVFPVGEKNKWQLEKWPLARKKTAINLQLSFIVVSKMRNGSFFMQTEGRVVSQWPIWRVYFLRVFKRGYLLLEFMDFLFFVLGVVHKHILRYV